MKKLIYSVAAFFCFVIINCCFVSKLDAASTVKFNGDTYTVNESNENNSDEKVKWITIDSDRTQGSRISIEMDLDLIKEYNSTEGLISYKAIKNWINNLEECLGYFCELNLNPQNTTLVIEFTGVSKQYASAYANGGSNKIVMNKNYHLGTLKLIERDYNSGITNLCGTVLHEMGHMFTKINGYSYFNSPWNYGTEYINLVLAQYVVDNMVRNNDNIVTNLYPYYDVICASSNVSNYNTIDGNSVTVVHNYKDGWDKICNQIRYFNSNDPSYSSVIYNTAVIMDTIGQIAFKRVMNKYFDDSINEYNVSNDYNKFMTFMQIIQLNTTSNKWIKLKSNYEFLYNKFVVNINTENTTLNIVKGKSYNIFYDVSFNSTTHPDFSVSFSSTNDNIASVDSNGKITANNIGSVKVYVNVGNQYKVINLNVVESGVTSISLNKTNYTFNSLNSYCKLTPTFNSSLDNNIVKWTSSNEDIAKVDSNGYIIPQGNGTATITATTTDGTNLSAKCNITVDIKATGISFSTTEYTITNIAQNPAFTPTITPSNAANKNVTWTSSNESVATVSTTGVIKAVGNGTCKITATTTDGTNLSASVNITVDMKVTGISFSITDYTITNIGQTPVFTPTITPSNAANKKVLWTSSDKSIATVSSTGVIKAVSNGTCKIIATTTDGTNLSASVNITVALPIKATGITTNIANYTITTIHDVPTFRATITPTNTTNKTVKWSSSNTNVATVSESGVVTAVGNGTCTITATTMDGTNLSASVNLTVSFRAESISLDKTSYTFNKNESLKLTATVLPDNTNNKTVKWESSNKYVAIVNSSGVVTAVGKGTCTITATTTDGTNKIASCNITSNIDYLKGDINGDGKVNIKDWNRLYNHINETEQLNEYELLCADINGDGKVNIKDWNRMYDHITEVNPLW